MDALPPPSAAKRYPGGGGGGGRDLRVLKESLCHVTIIFAPPSSPFQRGISAGRPSLFTQVSKINSGDGGSSP